MPRRTVLSIAGLAALTALLACDLGLTAPPHGLAVQLSRVNVPAPPTQFSADADSVMVVLSTALLYNNPCASSRVDAGVSGATLVITHTSQVTMKVCNALQAALFMPTTRLVVHGVPSGSYVVVLAERVTPWDGPETETDLAQGQVTVP
jgi:hypothetical protein